MEIAGVFGVEVNSFLHEFSPKYLSANILLKNMWNYAFASRSDWMTGQNPDEIFETEYFPLDHDGSTLNEAIRIFDLRRSSLHLTPHGNIHAPENSLFNIGNTARELVAPRPVGLFRRVPINWYDMKCVRLPQLSNPGEMTIIVENSNVPISLAEHQKETLIYNKHIKHGIRAKFLQNALAMQQQAYGHYKSPFEHPQNCHITKFRDVFNFETALKRQNTVQWLANLDGTLHDWAVSVTGEAQMEIRKYLEWMKDSVDGYRCNLKLQNKRMWVDERAEPNVYIDHLQRVIDMQEMIILIQQRTLRATNRHLSKTIHDLALLLEKTLDRFAKLRVITRYNNCNINFFSENGQLPGENVQINEYILETKICYFCFNETTPVETNSLWAYRCGHTYFLCTSCSENEQLKDCPLQCRHTCIPKHKIFIQVNNLA